MKRCVFTIIVFLLLLGGGAIVNVAVAWGCASWSGASVKSEDISEHLDAESKAWWLTRFPEHNPEPQERWTDDPFRHYYLESVLIAQASAFGVRGRNMYGTSSDRACAIWAGWPALTLTGESRDVGATRETVALVHAKGLPEFENDMWAFWFDRGLPLRPLWPGFAINTLFYAAILAGGWCLFAAPFAYRRRRRIKHGLCPKCAYPVGASEVCTECGAAVRPKAVAS